MSLEDPVGGYMLGSTVERRDRLWKGPVNHHKQMQSFFHWQVTSLLTGLSICIVDPYWGKNKNYGTTKLEDFRTS